MKRALELFSGRKGGSAGFSPEWEITTVEKFPQPGFEPTITADVLDLTPADLPGPWDFIWASPPCPAFSPGGNFGHFAEIGEKRYLPADREGWDAVRLVAATRNLLEVLRPKAAIIENPRGLLRYLWPVAGLSRVTVWYCQYGDISAKPTDLWLFGEAERFRFRPECRAKRPGMDWSFCHHEPAERGAKTGTQGKKGAAARAEVPLELSQEVAEQVDRVLAGDLMVGWG